jgi:hypothetical protein
MWCAVSTWISPPATAWLWSGQAAPTRPPWPRSRCDSSTPALGGRRAPVGRALLLITHRPVPNVDQVVRLYPAKPTVHDARRVMATGTDYKGK